MIFLFMLSSLSFLFYIFANVFLEMKYYTAFDHYMQKIREELFIDCLFETNQMLKYTLMLRKTMLTIDHVVSYDGNPVVSEIKNNLYLLIKFGATLCRYFRL